MSKLSEESKLKIREIIAEHLFLDLDQVQHDSKVRDLGADSLDEVELIMEFEKQFDCEIPDSEAEKVESVYDYYLILEQLEK